MADNVVEIKTVICSRCRQSVEGQEGRNYLICENANNQLFRRGEGILCVPCLGEGGGVEVSEGATKILKVRDKEDSRIDEVEEEPDDHHQSESLTEHRSEEEAPDSNQNEEEGKLQGD